MTNLVALAVLSLASPLVRFDNDSLAQSVYDTAFNEAVHLDRAQDAAWTACATPAALAARQMEVRAKTIAALGGFPEKTPLNAQVTGRVQKEGYVIVARRAEDAALAARWFAALCGGDRPELYVEGRAAIPAAHAKFLEKETFAGFVVEQPPAAWRQLLADPTIESRFADLVNGALRVYDWTDL